MNANRSNIPTHYHPDTPQAVRDILESCLHDTSRRVRLFFGDPETGDNWLEENDVTGTIGRSMGTQPIPLLIHNSRSMGGGAILDNWILRILVNGVERYRHPLYHTPDFTTRPSQMGGYLTEVLADGEVFARFHSHNSAVRWIAFMQGRRMCK